MSGGDHPSPSTTPDRGLRKPLLRFALLGVVVVAGFAAFRFTPLAQYLDREVIAGLLEQLRHAWWAPFALIGLYIVVSPLGAPATPLIFAGGAVFGVVWGGFYNFIGCFLGAAVSFLLARTLGRGLIVQLAGQERIESVERLLAKHGFWNLVRIRFIPVPFPVVNFGAAMAGVRLSTFLTSSALGLLPAILIYTYFTAALVETATGPSKEHLRNLVLAIVLFLALSMLPTLWKSTQKRRRERLLEDSETRDETGS